MPTSTLFITDRGIPISRQDIHDAKYIGQLRSVTTITVPVEEGLPVRGSPDHIYLIKTNGKLYRWSKTQQKYLQIASGDAGAITEAPIDGGNYVRSDGTWKDISVAGGDKNYTQEFIDNTALIFEVQHDLGKYPSVTILDTTKQEFKCAVEQLDKNRLRITMNAVIPHGYIILN